MNSFTREYNGPIRRPTGRKAAGVAAISLSPTALLGQSSEHLSSPPTGGGGSGSGKADDVEAKLANIVRKYGNRLSKEQRERLRRILVYNAKMMDGIRAVPLQNGNPPASVLRVSFDRRTADARQQTYPLPRKNTNLRGGEADGKVR